MHVSGNNSIQLRAESIKAITLDGSGKIDLAIRADDGPYDKLLSVDASNFAGQTTLNLAATHALAIEASSGGTTVWTSGDVADHFAFGAGSDVYKPLHFQNLTGRSSAFDSAAIQITNFDIHHDAIDVSGFGAKLVIDSEYLDNKLLGDAAAW